MAAEIVIVDDDPIVGTLMTDVLREAGYTTLWVQECFQAEQILRQTKPRLAILDIMIPGMDGLTLLSRVKEDPATRETKCIIVSGKAFSTDRERALQQGADLFIEKPFDIDTFSQTVQGLIGQPQSSKEAQPQPATSEIKVQVWGCRGRSGTRPKKSKIGLFGPSILLETPNRSFAFDTGSGLTGLGMTLSNLPVDRELWVLLTQAQPDHMEGLQNFAPITQEGRMLKIAGPNSPDAKLKDVLKQVLSKAAAKPKAKIELFELLEDAYQIAPDLRLAAMYARHPGITLVLSIELDGKKFVYAPDSELVGETASAMSDHDEKLARFAWGADLLVHNAYFTDKDFAPSTGHSQYLSTLALAKAADVKELWLFNINAAYEDERIEQIEADAQARAEKAGFRCRVAREGLTETL